ncbi:MAG TPA: Gfo/Idh/MocA family oxidoreductase [Bryobacteraceae bacterium]|nr:Gfo/Idh/MocA family oxidoreductase [Bryobacteraceae bacterium]
MNIGIIGLGFMGATHLGACSKLENLKVAAVSTRDPRALAGDLSHTGGNLKRETPPPDFSQAAKYTDWRELILDSNVDAVDICLPTELHEPVATAALAAGKHVLCEKPMALTSEACHSMLAIAERYGRILMIGHVLRFWPAYVCLRDFIQSGEYGRILSATFVRQCGIPDWSNWLPDENRSGGAVLDLLVHDIDQALDGFGHPQAVRAKSLGEVDTVAATLLYPDGPEVRIQGGWFKAGLPFSMSFQARAERAYLDYSESGLFLTDQTGQKTTVPDDGGDAYARQLFYFAECCINGRQPELCPPQQSAAAVALALALKESRRLNGELVRCEQ